MNIFNKVTLQSMKKSRTRTLVTIIGVMLSAAMITAVATFGVSLLNYMAVGAAQKYGDWHVQLVDVPASFAKEQALDPAVARSASYEHLGYATLEGSQNPDKPYVFIAGFGEAAFRTLPIHLLSGRLPENDQEILIPGSVEANGGVTLSVNDTISLAVGNRKSVDSNQTLAQHQPFVSDKEILVQQVERTYTVVGTYQRPRFEAFAAPGYTLITRSEPADAAAHLSVFVTMNKPGQIQNYLNRTAEGYAYRLNDDVLRFMGYSQDKLFNALLYAVGGIVTMIIMVGSIFLIYNAFTISLNERTRQFGILSSVGATAKQLRNSVLFEGLCIGAVGIPLGILVGIASMGLVISVVADNIGSLAYNNVSLRLTLSVPAIVTAAAVSLVTILISAYIPARKAAHRPVMESIRQSNEIKVEPKAVSTSRWTQRLYGLEGTLALKNFKRNKKRYRSIVLSLVLSVVLFISASAFVTYMKQASERAVVVTDYDISLATQDMPDHQMLALYDTFSKLADVYESSYQALIQYAGSVPIHELSDRYEVEQGSSGTEALANLPLEIQFLEDRHYLEIIEHMGLPDEVYMGRGDTLNLIAVAKLRTQDDSNQGSEQYVDLFTRSKLTLTMAPAVNGELMMDSGVDVSLTFAEIVPPDTLPILGSRGDSSSFLFRVLAPYSLVDRFETPHSPVLVKGLGLRSHNPLNTMNEMEEKMRQMDILSSYMLLNMHEMLDENRNIIFITNVFAYTFIVMISLIAVANVFNTISTNIKLRRRELAMLRSVGMSERSFQKMMNVECAFYGMRALMWGLPLAVLSSWLIYKGMVAGGADSIDFVFPWSSIGISASGVLLIVFITMLYAVSKIKKENIMDALRDEMT